MTKGYAHPGAPVSKHSDLLDLARLRQTTRWAGYHGIGDYHGGVYECDFVSPYTKSARNADADVMILFRDWGSHERLCAPIDEELLRSGFAPAEGRRLAHLLRTHLGLELGDTYVTSLFPFIKAGGVGAKIPSENLVFCAREFALPQVGIVSPRLLVCLGIDAFNAVRVALGYRRSARLADAIEDHVASGATAIWCQAPPDALGQGNRNRDGVDRVARDWSRMRDALAAIH